MAACPLASERVWVEKSQYQDAEQKYFEHLSKVSSVHTHVECKVLYIRKCNLLIYIAAVIQCAVIAIIQFYYKSF